jgi:hypothetical protein
MESIAPSNIARRASFSFDEYIAGPSCEWSIDKIISDEMDTKNDELYTLGFFMISVAGFMSSSRAMSI